MGFIRGLNKLLEGILLLIVPLIVFYWFLGILNLEMLKPVTAMFGFFFDQYIAFIKLFAHYDIVYNSTFIDFTPLIAALVVFISSFLVGIFDNMIGSLEHLLSKSKVKFKEVEINRRVNEQQNRRLEALSRNKIIYVALKFRKSENLSSYLYNNVGDSTSNTQLKGLIDNIVNNSEKFKAKNCGITEDESKVYSFMFYNVTDAIDYSFYIYNKIVAADMEFSKLGMKFSATIACHCGHGEETAAFDFSSTAKILKLGGDNEILASEIFKEKYEALKEETNLKFDSKGYYNINDAQIEVYQLRVSSIPRNIQ